jgi:hypothetical protein
LHAAEGVTADHLLILGNRFHEIGRSYNYLSLSVSQTTAVIDFHVSGSGNEHSTLSSYSSCNVQIRGNTFSAWRNRAISLRNVANAVVSNNLIALPHYGTDMIATVARYDGSVTIERNFIFVGGQNLHDSTVEEYRFLDNHPL